jgi:hypothetical protein
MLPFKHKGYRLDFTYKYMVFEIDSEYHNKAYDSRRDSVLRSYGYSITRIYWKDLYNKKKLSIMKKMLDKIIEKKLYKKVKKNSLKIKNVDNNKKEVVMNYIANGCLAIGTFSLGILLFIVLAFHDGIFPVEKDTRIFSQGKSFMTDFVTCINVCKEFEKQGKNCKCDVYTKQQMDFYKKHSKEGN